MNDMKFLLCVLGVFLVMWEINCRPDFMEHMKTCQRDFGMEEGKPPDMNDPESNCLMACIVEKMGSMIDGKINKPVFVAKIQEVYDNTDPDVKTKIEDCVDLGNAKEDKCEAIVEAYNCIKDFLGPPNRRSD